jgi:hypothetical protein
MKNFPMPDDGFGLIGDLRTFTLDGTSWRAFEYLSPVTRDPRKLLVVASDDGAYFEMMTFPVTWRLLSPAELVALLPYTPD